MRSEARPGDDDELNIVFAGNILYPVGMAGTKRVQHFIDHVQSLPGAVPHVLLFRQGHVGRNTDHLHGRHRGVEFTTIGEDIAANWKLPWAMVKYLYGGLRLLSKWRITGAGKNLLFIYGPPNIENVLFILFARLSGYRVMFDIVEDFYLIEPDAPLLSRVKSASVNLFARRIRWFADGLIVISAYLKEKFEQTVAGSIPICLIPVSVDTKSMTLSAREFHAPVRIVYAGSFGDKDGVENLVSAVGEIIEKNYQVKLELAGRGMPEQIRKVESLIADERFAGKVVNHGFLDDEAYYRMIGEADILCVVRVGSAFAERGFPFKLGEFLATGRPVIASRVGDIPGYLSDHENALLVEPGSVAGIVDAIRFLLDDPERALQIGKAGRQVAETRFDTEVHQKQFLAFIRDELLA